MSLKACVQTRFASLETNIPTRLIQAMFLFALISPFFSFNEPFLLLPCLLDCIKTRANLPKIYHLDEIERLLKNTDLCSKGSTVSLLCR